MAVFLNVELALTGLIYEIIKQKRIELGEEFYWDRVNGMLINSELVSSYLAWLTYSDCGPIISGFDKAKILYICQKSVGVLKKIDEDVYAININPNINSLNPNNENFESNLIEFLVEQFQPKMNYSRKFFNFMFTDSKKLVKK